MKVALISCSKRKRMEPCVASEMYTPSNLFSRSFEYAKQFADRIFILSAKYGLLEEDTSIETYNLNLKELSSKERLEWAQNVMVQLQNNSDLELDHFMILAGKTYYENLLPSLPMNSIPLEHVLQGDRTNALQELINVCDELHALFNSARRYTSSDIAEIPFANGIYIVFEKNERFKGWERIVRIGTHDAQGRLRERLKDHFVRKNKDGSIFRKNVGKAILKQRSDPFLPMWTLDTSKPENRSKVDFNLQESVEKEVSAYLNQNMSFAVIAIEDIQQRLRIEKAIISSLNQAIAFKPSETWLGNYSSEIEIRESGLWLKRGLNDFPLNYQELLFLREALTSNQEAIPIAVQLGTEKTKKVRPNYRVADTDIQKTKSSTGTAEIRAYIFGIFEQFRAQGEDSCTLVSGEIHRAMGLKHLMPSVCNAMYQLRKDGDEIVHSPPKGKGSTLRIQYLLR